MYIAQVLSFITGVAAITIPEVNSLKARQVGSTFPSGSISCSNFPSQYGAVSTSWTNHGGWTGIQSVPGYTPGDNSISTVINEPNGPCKANAFCSYACPPGYQKSQFPSAQPNNGATVGGLYCNSNGLLELSNPSVTTLCTAGVGGVTAKNSLTRNVAVCRTDLPGNEDPTIPLDTGAGQSLAVTVPNFNYFTINGQPTSAQYYINPSGVSVANACQFGTAGSNQGNYAPVILGAGRNSGGTTFLSLLPNTPTSNGKLDFNVRITGAVSSACSYQNGQFLNNGVVSSGGCTVSLSGAATVEFF